MTESEREWRQAWTELAALLSVTRCESRVVFEDRLALGVAISWSAEGPLIWGLLEDGAGGGRLESLWSMAHELEEHRFESSARALLELERALRRGLAAEGAVSAEAQERLLLDSAGSRSWGPKASARSPGAQLALMDGAMAWSRVAAAFEPRSERFCSALKAFSREELIQGSGRSMMESEELNEAAGPGKTEPGARSGAKGL